MRPAVLILLVVSAGSLAAPPSAKPDSAERKRLSGTWRGRLANENEPTIELIITPTTIKGRSIKSGESLGEGTYRLDPAKKTIDTHGIKDPVKGTDYLGIYSLEGNTLKWCSSNGSHKRPRTLASARDGSSFLMILERQK